MDTDKYINCPACGNEMTKIFITEKGINIDICTNNCGGIYFDNQEIQEINDSKTGLIEIKKILSDKNFMPIDTTQTRLCPNCNTPMVKTNALGIQIDTCYKCGGIFLDYGEFEQVKSNFKKRLKIQPVNFDTKSEINLREFYKDTQNEIFIEESHKFTTGSFLNILLRIIF